jgi:hypothetical protein
MRTAICLSERSGRVRINSRKNERVSLPFGFHLLFFLLSPSQRHTSCDDFILPHRTSSIQPVVCSYWAGTRCANTGEEPMEEIYSVDLLPLSQKRVIHAPRPVSRLGRVRRFLREQV